MTDIQSTKTPDTDALPGTVLVTGGTGYVASWCIVELLKQGYNVRTTIRNLSKEGMLRSTISSAIDPAGRLSVYGADLTADTGWKEAMTGCDYVLHVASPLGANNPKDPNELIIPAREGTLRVLRAAAEAEVKRVVMTSSLAAATPVNPQENQVIDESVWSDPEDKFLDAYRKSKVLAEMAAWQFIKEHKGSTTLTTILPGAIFGPVLSANSLGSVQVISRLVQGRVPGTPRLGFEIVDVRDLADLHIRAMTAPEADSQRFIAVGDFMWMTDIAGTLRSRLGTKGSRVPTRKLPDFMLRLVSRFDPSLRSIVPMLGRQYHSSPAKAKRLLGWSSRPAADTVVDTANSLIEKGAVP